MRFKYIKLIILLLPMTAAGQKAQRIQPGKMYDAGETLFAPRYGFTSVVPAGWSGVLPRETEVFLLNALTNPSQIFLFAREQGTLALLKSNWDKGVDLSDDVYLMAKATSIQNGLLSSEVTAKGPYINKGNRGYAVARCSDSGPCVICLAVGPAQFYEEIKKAADGLLSSSKMEKPSLTSLYGDFDWKEFLSGKMVTTYAFIDEGSKETVIDLCADGTFTGKVSKKGIFKDQNPAYKNKMKGTWSAEGVGAKGKLKLTFEKLPPLEATMQIDDEKIFGNGERYFVGESEKCKK
jgi:hypothetical protein